MSIAKRSCPLTWKPTSLATNTHANMSEKLDQIDQANEFAAAFTSEAISAVRSLVPDEREEPEEDMTCVRCCSDVPAKRWAKGYDVCVHCSDATAKRDKQYRSSRYDD